MRKSITACILATCLMFFFTNISAQNLTKKFSFGLGFEGGFTMGDAKDSYPNNGGLTLRLAFHAGPGFATLTSGALAFFPKSFKDEDNLKAGVLIPVRFGYKYIIQDKFFVMGELGYGNFKQFYKDDESDGVASTSEGGFLYAPSAGVQFGKFEAGLRYESVSLNGGSLSSFGARLGFNF